MPRTKAARRVRGEGSIFQRKDGYWVGSVRHRAGGLLTRHDVYATTKAEAAKKLGELRDSLGLGLDPRKARATRVRSLVATWLTDVERSKRTSTVQRYKIDANRICEIIGDVRLADVDADTVRALDDSMRRSGATAAARRRTRSILSSIFASGVRARKLARNPVSEVPAPAHTAERIPPMTATQTRALIAAARGERFGALVILVATVGLRWGEAIGLKRDDLDLDRRALTVRRSLRETPTGIEETAPKTTAGYRTVALPSITVAALRDHVAGVARGSYLFLAERGGPLRKSVFMRKEWKPFLDRHGFPKEWTFRGLRHAAATRMAEAGAHPRFVQEMLGHTSSEMTLGVYTHASADLQREAVKGLDALLSEGRAK